MDGMSRHDSTCSWGFETDSTLGLRSPNGEFGGTGRLWAALGARMHGN